MSKGAISTVWTAAGVATLVLSVNAVLYVQGSEIFFPTVNYYKAERYSTAVYGLLVTALPFYMMVRLAKLYRRQHGDGTWTGSIPVAFNLDIAAASRAGREFQVWVVVLFGVLPVFCRYLLLRKLFKASIFEKVENVKVISGGVLEHLCTPYPFTVVFGADYTIGSAQHGVTYFPFWQSWAHLILEIALWGYMLSFVVSQHRHRTRPPSSAAEAPAGAGPQCGT